LRKCPRLQKIHRCYLQTFRVRRKKSPEDKLSKLVAGFHPYYLAQVEAFHQRERRLTMVVGDAIAIVVGALACFPIK
jgi:hypothetical protein